MRSFRGKEWFVRHTKEISCSVVSARMLEHSVPSQSTSLMGVHAYKDNERHEAYIVTSIYKLACKHTYICLHLAHTRASYILSVQALGTHHVNIRTDQSQKNSIKHEEWAETEALCRMSHVSCVEADKHNVKITRNVCSEGCCRKNRTRAGSAGNNTHSSMFPGPVVRFPS
jgi:hypothetical protein